MSKEKGRNFNISISIPPLRRCPHVKRRPDDDEDDEDDEDF